MSILKKAAGFLISLAILLPIIGLAGFERPFTPDSEWSPPDLSSANLQTPELLVLRIAQEEVGYREGPLKDQSKYGEWFGKRQTAWCAEFITWCVHQVDLRHNTHLLGKLYPYNGGPKTGTPFYIKSGRFISDTGKLTTHERQWFLESKDYVSNNSYTPYPGDLVWFCYYKRGETDHIAIVEGISINQEGKIQIHVIEGNKPDSVQRAVYALDDRTIYGYGTPVQRVMTNMRLYNRNQGVKQLKENLAKIGLLKEEGKNPDEFTIEVKEQIVQFQREHGITATGVVDMETWLAIEAVMGEPIGNSIDLPAKE